jgi:hypothetical protein
MALTMHDFHDAVVLRDAADVRHALGIRYEHGANELWLAHDSRKYPVLAILLRDDVAVLHYFPEERDPGFQSRRRGAAPPATVPTEWFMSPMPADNATVPDDAVVPVESALEAALQFFERAELPTAIDWFEL